MRLTNICFVGLLAVAACSAGSIEIGGTNGLTASYITSGCAGAGPCVTGSAGSFAESNYTVRLFESAQNGSTPAQPYSSYNQTTPEVGSLSSPYGTFAMINDSTVGGASENFWSGNGTSAITVPIGLNNVSSVATMISNVFGLAGSEETEITFNYGTTSNASSFNNVISVELTNAGGSGSGASGEIGTSVDCQNGGSFGSGNCNSKYAVGPTASSSTLSDLESTTLTVLSTNIATNLFGSNGDTYNSGGSPVFAGTSGTISLDAQDFLLGALVAPSPNEYLVSITLQDLSGVATVSNTALTAITVNTTPEPSTVILFMTGLGALGLVRLRRKKA